MTESIRSNGDRSVAAHEVIGNTIVTGDHNVIVTGPDGRKAVVDVFALVPPPSFKLIGRDDLLADFKAALGIGLIRNSEPDGARRQAVMALVGIPGVGKTTLATALAYDADVLQRYVGGVLWANVGQSPNLDDVLNRWADALGVDATNEPTTEARTKRVQVALKARPFMIVLDDVWTIEHALVLRLVTSPGSVHVLTTRDESISRRFAGTAGYHVVELSENDGARLLAELCPPSVPASDTLFRGITRSVGGLPLALTLVAGYICDRVFLVPQRCAAFDALSSAAVWLGLRDIERQLTLADVIGLSIDALSDDARRAFVVLGAFAPKPASFSVDAARSVAGANFDQLGELVRRNLSEIVGEERVTLHQTLAAVAVERDREVGRLREHQIQHARYYLEFVDHDHRAWQQIETELPQVRRAWDWLSGPDGDETLVLGYVQSLRFFQNTRGLWREEIDWCQRGISAARLNDAHQLEAMLENNIGWCLQRLNELEQALDHYSTAMEIRHRIGDTEGMASTLQNIGSVDLSTANYPDALQILNRVLSQCKIIGDLQLEAAILTNISAAYQGIGQTEKALDYVLMTIQVVRTDGNRLGEANALNNFGAICVWEGKRQLSLEWFDQALTIFRDLGDLAGEALVLTNIAEVYHEDGRIHDAEQLLEQVVRIEETIGHPERQKDRVKLDRLRELSRKMKPTSPTNSDGTAPSK